MSGIVGDNLFRASGVIASSASDYDDDQIQSNIAMLGFYVAVNGSLVRYNLVDQSIDEFFDTSGVDASASVNDRRVDAGSGANYYYDGEASGPPTRTEDSDSSSTDGTYTIFKWTSATSSGDYSADVTESAEYLVIGGGGGGGDNSAGGNAATGGGGGAGGLLSNYGGSAISLTADATYAITVGAGGTVADDTAGGNGGSSILSGTGISTVTGGGGGGGGNDFNAGINGDGSGGGGGGEGGSGGTAGTAGGVGAGNNGGVGGYGGGTYGAGSGGGAGAVGGAGTANSGSSDGGVGLSNSITGSAVYYAGGGGAGGYAIAGADGGNGGGGNGTMPTSYGNLAAEAGTNGTGGGGGGGGQNHGDGGVGGTGLVMLRVLTNVTTAGADLTLQSTDVTAESEPDYAELVILIENAYGTATLNTDIKGFVSEDSGVTFTEGTLVDEGSWGTNKKILGFHDLDISAQSGTSMCYKITTHNQSASSKETRIYATSIGWR